MDGIDLRRELARLRVAESLPSALAVACAGAALYGAALGVWHGPRMALYAAVKLPLVLLATGTATLASTPSPRRSWASGCGCSRRRG